jgi:putative transposase
MLARMDNLPRKPGYRALRKGRCSISGQCYLITTVCAGRTPRFADWDAASRMSSTLVESRLWRTSRLQCWVLMPDHLHLMVELGSEPLPRLVQRVKAITSRTLNRFAGVHAQALWMPGYHDRALRRDEDLQAVARYVIANPLRAGLAESIGGYPYWDAIWMEGGAEVF